jgi:hypothetical protein
MDTGLTSQIRSAIAHEVETAVSNTKQDLLTNIVVLIDSRLNTFYSNINNISASHDFLRQNTIFRIRYSQFLVFLPLVILFKGHERG